jgi:hypothetical protein
MGAAALRYAGLGFEVIPLARGGKRPHAMLGDRGGIHLASKDPGQIMDWWSLDMVANIGVATGSVNSLAVVDLDIKRGNDGITAFYSMLEAWAMPWPDERYSVTARTPSGGLHLWLRMEGGTPERPGILPGVDVKGDGGLVVAPPSAQMIVTRDRPGERGGAEVPVPYEWITGCPHAVPVVPPWFSIWLDQAPAPHARRNQDALVGGESTPLDEALEIYMRDGVPQGMRNREIYRIACKLFRRHGTDSGGARNVSAIVRDVYDKTDKSGFEWREVLVCLESARRFIEREKIREGTPTREMLDFIRWTERNR